MKKWYNILIIILFVVAVGLIGYNRWSNKNLSYVTISINPEIELVLDRTNEVKEVVSINEDADVLTSDLDLVGLTIEEASEKIIDAAMETGYLDEYSDENTVVVTTINDNEEKRQALEEKIMTKFSTHFEERKIYPVLVAKGLNDDLKAEADEYGISNGKMLLVETALALNNTLSKDELVNMQVREIQNEIKTYVKERRAALKESLADAKEAWRIEKATLKQQYTQKIDELKASITEEHKEEFKSMTPDQKKEAIKTYLNERKKAIKDDINAVRSEIKAEVKEDMKGYNYPVLENNTNAIKENIKGRIEQRRNK